MERKMLTNDYIKGIFDGEGSVGLYTRGEGNYKGD